MRTVQEPVHLAVRTALHGKVKHAGNDVVAAGSLTPRQHDADLHGRIDGLGFRRGLQLHSGQAIRVREQSLDLLVVILGSERLLFDLRRQ